MGKGEGEGGRNVEWAVIYQHMNFDLTCGYVLTFAGGTEGKENWREGGRNVEWTAIY